MEILSPPERKRKPLHARRVQADYVNRIYPFGRRHVAALLRDRKHEIVGLFCIPQSALRSYRAVRNALDRQGVTLRDSRFEGPRPRYDWPKYAAQLLANAGVQ